MTPVRLAAVLGSLLLATSIAHAGEPLPRIFSDGFEAPPAPPIEPLLPIVDGSYQLPAGPAADQLEWLVAEMAQGENTTLDEIDAHFTPAYVGQIGAEALRDFVNGLRGSFADARLVDIVTLTPVRAVGVIERGSAGTPYGFVNLAARYTGAQQISQLGVSNFFGSVMFPDDQTLTLQQAADRFVTLSADPALLVARVQGGQCVPLAARNADALRATASIFKTWVLGGVAQAVADGDAMLDEPIELVSSELALGGAINVEPTGTDFSLLDMAVLMLGISDNTATDHLHERVGRGIIGQFIADAGVADPTVLTPLLGISEQFHLIYSFPLAQAQQYVNGSEAFQEEFLQDEIVPLGPMTGGSFFNVSLLTSGTWRASPTDICHTLVALRDRFGGDAHALIDQSLGASAAQPNVRPAWDRVWYKGGSLASGSSGFHVLTHAWMLQNDGEDAYVVVAMSNDDAGGIDQFDVQSVTGRMLELIAELP